MLGGSFYVVCIPYKQAGAPAVSNVHAVLVFSQMSVAECMVIRLSACSVIHLSDLYALTVYSQQ